MKIVVALIVSVLFVEGLNMLKHKLRYGASCCGEKTPVTERVRATDEDVRNYPFHYRLNVEGMTCTNCARMVENAFHQTGEAYARVNLKDKQVSLWFKRRISRKEVAEIIDEAGYTLMEFEEEGKSEAK